MGSSELSRAEEIQITIDENEALIEETLKELEYLDRIIKDDKFSPETKQLLAKRFKSREVLIDSVRRVNLTLKNRKEDYENNVRNTD